MLTQTKHIDRNQERKKLDRRQNDRRQLSLEFGSPEWVDHVKNNYVSGPKFDSRQSVRRDGERRDVNNAEELSNDEMNDYTSDLLTNEEKIYFNQLFMNE